MPKRGERAFLRFGAVDYHAYVYLNGKFVGEHEGGFTPFAFEVTNLLRDGDNRVTVGADSERTAADVPPVVTDWENYGGITRPVSLDHHAGDLCRRRLGAADARRPHCRDCQARRP